MNSEEKKAAKALETRSEELIRDYQKFMESSDTAHYLGMHRLSRLAERISLAFKCAGALGATHKLACSVIKDLEGLRALDKDGARRFMSQVSEWPMSLSPSQKGWAKGKMPKRVEEVLYNSGLGSSKTAYPLKGADDLLGRWIKDARTRLARKRYYEGPDWKLRQMVDVGLESEALIEIARKLPELDRTSACRRAWAKPIFGMLFGEYDIGGDVAIQNVWFARDFARAGGKALEMATGLSVYFDSHPVVYSALLPFCETATSRSKSESARLWEGCFKEASKSAQGRLNCDAIKHKAVEIFRRRYGPGKCLPWEISDIPTDEEFKEQSIQFIAGRLKSMNA